MSDHLPKSHRRIWVVVALAVLFSFVIGTTALFLSDPAFRKLCFPPTMAQLPPIEQIDQVSMNFTFADTSEPEISVPRVMWPELFALIKPNEHYPGLSGQISRGNAELLSTVKLKMKNGEVRTIHCYDHGCNPLIISENREDAFWGGDFDINNQRIHYGLSPLYHVYRKSKS